MGRFSEQVDNMTWSYSRLLAYEDCPYKWVMQYIGDEEQQDMFFANYGSLVHKVIDGYYKGIYSKEDLCSVFISNFQTEVKGHRPKIETVKKYLDAAINYFKTFEPFPFKMIATELEVNFKIEGYPFMGFIDYLGEEDGGLVIVDNKSRDLKPRSKRKKPTLADLELDKYLVQLYLYSEGIRQIYGTFPRYLYLNCFRSGVFIKEQFDLQKCEDAKRWAVKTIQKIRDDDEFIANPEFFKCRWLCGVNKDCDYKFNEF